VDAKQDLSGLPSYVTAEHRKYTSRTGTRLLHSRTLIGLGFEKLLMGHQKTALGFANSRLNNNNRFAHDCGKKPV
jgi:hypothetical protein